MRKMTMSMCLGVGILQWWRLVGEVVHLLVWVATTVHHRHPCSMIAIINVTHLPGMIVGIVIEVLRHHQGMIAEALLRCHTVDRRTIAVEKDVEIIAPLRNVGEVEADQGKEVDRGGRRK